MLPFLSRYLPTGLVLTLGLGMTISATVWVGRWERLSQQSEFQKQINNLTTAVQRTTHRYNELLLSISDLYDATSHDGTSHDGTSHDGTSYDGTDHRVDRPAFRRFVQRAVSTYPGIQALEWAPLVPHAERATYEQRLQQSTGQAPLGITERNSSGDLISAAVRNHYVPVTFVEPWFTNEAALGYDLASDNTRRRALERARDTGAIAATGRLQLVQETTNNQYSFLVFVPVYRQATVNTTANATTQATANATTQATTTQVTIQATAQATAQATTTLAARRQQLQGYILGVFRVADVIEESLSDLNSDIDFYIFDQTAPPDSQLLGFYDAQAQQVITPPHPTTPSLLESHGFCPGAAPCTQSIQLGQREWQIVFLPPAPWPWLWNTVATLIIGVLITATLLIYLWRWQSELERTRELSDLKLRLFSMASHELRTPLSVITISAQSLGTNGEHWTTAQQTNTITRIQLAAKRMGQLVSDILTLTRAEAGKLEFNPEIVVLDSFCQQIFNQIQLQSGQTILLTGSAVNHQAYLDKKLVQSILINLLSNAAKYSPEKSQIQLIITETTDTLNFQVVDQGIGIPPVAQQQIFDAFYRGQNVGQVQGTGLGLAVVKTCVDLHGGSLHLKSSAHQGTCISVQLPRVE